MALTKEDLKAIQHLMDSSLERFEKTALPAAFERFEKTVLPAAFERFEKTVLPAAFERFEKTALPAAFERFGKTALPAAFERFQSGMLPLILDEAFQRYDEQVALPRHHQVMEHIDGLAKRISDRDEEFELLRAQCQRTADKLNS